MTGSVQEKKGYWYLVISYYNQERKRKLKWVSTNLKIRGNKRAAMRMLEKYLEEHEDSQLWNKAHMYFDEFILSWLETAKINLSSSTYLAYKYQIESQIVPYFKPLKLKVEDITSQILQDYYNMKLKSLSGNTVRKHHANIHKALSYAVYCRMIKYNPADYVILPKKERYEASFYNSDEAQRLLKIFKDDVLEPVIVLTLHYGFRRSEVLGLKWTDIDFDNDVIYVRNTVKTVNGTIIREESTKNESSRRVMPLIKSIKQYLLKLRLKQKEEKLFYGNTYIDSEYICRWNNGNLIKPDYVTRHFKQIITENNMRVIRFHDLRHSTASILLELGMNLKDIQEWLGHSEITTTNIYAHLQVERKQHIGKTVENALNYAI